MMQSADLGEEGGEGGDKRHAQLRLVHRLVAADEVRAVALVAKIQHRELRAGQLGQILRSPATQPREFRCVSVKGHPVTSPRHITVHLPYYN